MKTMEHLAAALVVLLSAIITAMKRAHTGANGWGDSWSDWDPFATGYRDGAYPAVDGLWSPSRKAGGAETTFSVFEWGLPRAHRGH